MGLVESGFLFGLVGLFVIPTLAWLMSVNRSIIMWKVLFVGLGIQLLLGVLVLLTKPGQLFFQYMNDIILGLLELSDRGAKFLFGDLVNAEFAGAQFAFSVLPTIIFFSALMSILYYSGVMQKVVELFAWIMMKLLGTSGAETLSVSSNIFVGQTEAPLVVRPFVKNMTMSELNTIMTSGFATVAGGVMAAYVGMLSGYFPGIAGHLLTASIMSAPAAIVMSKLCYPETGDPETRGEVKLEIEERHENVIDAAAGGAKSGLTLAFNVASMLLAFVALVWLGNTVFGWYGDKINTLFSQEMTAFKAFSWGAIVGIGIQIFLVSRVHWKKELTKFWLGGLVLLFGLPAAGFTLLPEFLVRRFRLVPSSYAEILSQFGGWSMLLLALAVLFLWQERRLNRWIISLAWLLGGGLLFGTFSWGVHGTNSGPLAAAVSAGLLAFLCFVVIWWLRPNLQSALTVAVIVLGAGLLAGLVTDYFSGIQILGTGGLMAELSLQRVLGYAFSLIALLIGVPPAEVVQVGRLIGEKIAINEFVAFLSFQEMAEAGKLSARSMVIASYALCGFANFSSIAIQIGGIGGIAPSRQSDLAKLGLRAMVAGALASFQTATVAGIMFTASKFMDIDLVAGEVIEAGINAGG